MKKRIVLLALVLLCTLVLAGCFCEHEWAEADCVNPKTCTKCGETEGAALGHVWMAATCTEPKTCEVCAATEGEAKGHAMVEASCTEAKHCSQCNLVEGDALGHDWQEATTEAPKTCLTCNETEGERIITDARFKTAANADLFGKWACAMELDGELLGIPDFEGDLSFIYNLEFGNAGDMSLTLQIGDEDSFMEAIILSSVASTYAELEAQNISKEEADAAMKQEFGMDVEEYVRASMANISMNDILASVFSAIDLGGVYYVENGQIYAGADWNSEMDPSGFSLDGDQLIIDSMSTSLGFDAVFIRVTE